MISVIIPTYNRKAAVHEAVTSVLSQKGVDFNALEVIVVDDGSTDDTPSLLEPLTNTPGSPVRCLRQAHAGVSAARNHGIREAAGEWLAFLDSDDLWLPRKLAVQMDYLAHHPEIKICQTEEIWIRNGLRLNPKKYHQKPEGHCFPLILDRCLVSPSAVMIHRDIFREVGFFDEALPACEDYDLWLRIGCRHPIGLVKDPLIIKHGGHPDQLSATVPALDRYRIHSLVNLLRREPLDAEQRHAALTVLDRKCRVYAEGCRKRGRMEEAEAVLALSCNALNG